MTARGSWLLGVCTGKEIDQRTSFQTQSNEHAVSKAGLQASDALGHTDATSQYGMTEVELETVI